MKYFLLLTFCIALLHCENTDQETNKEIKSLNYSEMAE